MLAFMCSLKKLKSEWSGGGSACAWNQVSLEDGVESYCEEYQTVSWVMMTLGRLSNSSSVNGRRLRYASPFLKSRGIAYPSAVMRDWSPLSDTGRSLTATPLSSIWRDEWIDFPLP